MSFLTDRPVAKITASIVVVAPLIALLTGTIPETNMNVVTALITLGGGFLFGASAQNKV